jgi:hypothetical protein
MFFVASCLPEAFMRVLHDELERKRLWRAKATTHPLVHRGETWGKSMRLERMRRRRWRVRLVELQVGEHARTKNCQPKVIPGSRFRWARVLPYT